MIVNIYCFYRQYLWQDDKGKKLKLSASQYIDYIMTYCQKTINDETIFPTKHGEYFNMNLFLMIINEIIYRNLPIIKQMIYKTLQEMNSHPTLKQITFEKCSDFCFMS